MSERAPASDDLPARAPLRAVLIGHGDLAEGMVDAVRRITGAGEEVIAPVSNAGKSPEALTSELERILGDTPGIIFTDLQGGSCGFVARRFVRSDSGHAVISGVNLPLLIDYAMNRNLPFDELVPRLLSRGRASICCAPAHLEEHADRAASR